MASDERLVVALDPAVAVSAAEFVAWWAEDAEASALGRPRITRADGGGDAFFPGMLELIAIPLVVNLASSAIYDLMRRLLARSGKVSVERVELVESQTAEGDRLVVVRRRPVSTP